MNRKVLCSANMGNTISSCFLCCYTVSRYLGVQRQYLRLSKSTCFPGLFLDYNVPGLIIFSLSLAL